jgi:YHS domain-containing protein
MMTLLSRRAMLGVALISAIPAQAQNALLLADNRVAIRGYDPVAYFTIRQPVKGLPEFVAEYDESTYWFSTAEHRNMFVADPDRYAPQFRGLCAISVSLGMVNEPDPEAWAIANGKLYLFNSKDGVTYFRQQTASIVSKATEIWPGLPKPQ